MKNFVLILLASFIVVGCSRSDDYSSKVQTIIEDEYNNFEYNLYGWEYSLDEISTLATELTKNGVNLASKEILWAGYYQIVREVDSDEDFVTYFTLEDELDYKSYEKSLRENYDLVCRVNATFVYAVDSGESADQAFNNLCDRLDRALTTKK